MFVNVHALVFTVAHYSHVLYLSRMILLARQDLAARFRRVLRDDGRAEDFALVEAALHAHKTKTHGDCLRQRKRAVREAITPVERAASTYRLHQFMAKGFSGVLPPDGKKKKVTKGLGVAVSSASVEGATAASDGGGGKHPPNVAASDVELAFM